MTCRGGKHGEPSNFFMSSLSRRIMMRFSSRLARLGQDVAGHVEVAVEQLQQQGEVVGIALVRRGREEEEVVGLSRRGIPANSYRWVL